MKGLKATCNFPKTELVVICKIQLAVTFANAVESPIHTCVFGNLGPITVALLTNNVCYLF